MMNRVVLSVFCITLCLIGTLAIGVPKKPAGSAPKPAGSAHKPPKPGDVVGVRAKAYEEKSAEVKLDKISIHPGIVVAGPDPTGAYLVAMISKKLPNNPPKQNIKKYLPDGNIYGNITLQPPRPVQRDDMKAWKDDQTGEQHVPLTPAKLELLKEDLEPYKDWKPPPRPPPPPRLLPGSHRPPQAPNRPASGASRRPSSRQVNSHVSSSRYPPPGSSSSPHGASSGSYRGGTHPAGGYGSTGGSSSRHGPAGDGSSRSHTDSSGRWQVVQSKSTSSHRPPPNPANRHTNAL